MSVKLGQSISDEAFPPATRSDVVAFIIDNRSVYNALLELLNEAREPGDIFNATLPPRKAELRGGQKHIDVLLALASETGLHPQPIPQWIGVAGVTLQVPGKPLSLMVTYN